MDCNAYRDGYCLGQKEPSLEDCGGQKKRCKLPSASKTHDTVNHPDHYNAGGIECIDGLKAATNGLEGIEAFCTANAIKYLWRWKYKNGVEDLKKAIWYINYLIAELDNNS